jgi:hypothetical protein
MIFPLLDVAVEEMLQRLNIYPESQTEHHDFPWRTYTWESPTFRRANLDVIDVRDTKKLYMMHLCVFPHLDDPSPVFGFDLVAGPKLVTGAFHDFSPMGASPMNDWFQKSVSAFIPTKRRELPPWAKEIFSDSMMAASSVKDPEELASIINLMTKNLDYFLKHVGSTRTSDDYTQQQNKYCHNQKQNPHTPRVMAALGFDEVMTQNFIQNCLFPEL